MNDPHRRSPLLRQGGLRICKTSHAVGSFVGCRVQVTPFVHVRLSSRDERAQMTEMRGIFGSMRQQKFVSLRTNQNFGQTGI